MELLERITIEPGKRGGRLCVRGIRITVSDVFGLLAHGLTPVQVLEQMPDLEPEDIRACLEYAARYMEQLRPASTSS
jgi:uncharacterized protein (DUF433 family)